MKKTLIVLGAGASKSILDFFPTGVELIIDINYHLTTEIYSPPVQGVGPYLSAMTNTLLDVLERNWTGFNFTEKAKGDLYNKHRIKIMNSCCRSFCEENVSF